MVKLADLKSLTKQQEEMIPLYIEKWKNISCDTTPLDQEQVKKAIIRSYECVNIEPPKHFHFVKNPEEAVKMYFEIVGKNTGFPTFVYSYHNSSLAIYDYLYEVVGVEDCADVLPLIDLAHCCGWFIPHEDFVIVSEKHREYHIDEEGRLHNDNGPAIAYENNFKLWFIHGKEVTEQIVMSPETLTIKQIDNETDTEVRAIMLDRYGWVNYIKNANCEVLDERLNRVEGTYEALYTTPFDKSNRLVVTCPTGRIFALSVPNSVKTCRDAKVWLDGDRKFNVIART